MNNKVNLVVCLDFPPIGTSLRVIKISELSELKLWSIPLLILHSSVKNVSGDFSEIFKAMNYYHLQGHQFIDSESTLQSIPINDMDVLIISFETDKQKLDSMVQIRDASPIDVAAWEIRHGK